MRALIVFLIFGHAIGFAQTWDIQNHPNNRRKAIYYNDQKISNFLYTEVSSLAEGKAYVAKGELYAYIDKDGNQLTPYVFAVASDFKNGYALVGDSFSQSVLNKQMHLIVPFGYIRAKTPVQGLILVQSQFGFWGAFDVQGNEKIPCIYDLPPKIVNRDTIIVRKSDEYGVINDCNEVIYNCSYQYIDKAGYGYRSGKYLKLF